MPGTDPQNQFRRPPEAASTERTGRLAGIILAGGKSTRFGTDKASAVVAGRTLLQWVASALADSSDSLVIVAAAGQQLPDLDVPVPTRRADDLYPGKGPFAGIVTGFAATDVDLCFVASCDAPLLQPALVRLLAGQLGDHDLACPFVNGYLQPLAALYRRERCLPVFRDCVEQDRLKITPAFDHLDALIVGEAKVRSVDPALESFLNMNRPELLVEVADRLGRR